MVLLFFLIPFNPHVSGLLLLHDRFIEISDLVCLLLFVQIELLFNRLPFDFCGLQRTLQLYDLAVLVFNLVLPLYHLLLLQPDNVLQTTVSFDFVS